MTTPEQQAAIDHLFAVRSDPGSTPVAEVQAWHSLYLANSAAKDGAALSPLLEDPDGAPYPAAVQALVGMIAAHVPNPAALGRINDQLVDALEDLVKQVAANAREEEILGIPLAGVSMRNTWKPGERVEHVSGGRGGAPQVLRPGTVASVDDFLRRHERLKVRFDDGEVRYITSDTMRHTRGQQDM